ncbi:MAG: pitrilysin family protein [Raineya sp.]|nr:pitrilysin family protein [Raineya sp.]
MLRTKLIFSACGLLMALVALGQAKLVQKVTKKGNEIVIPYEKYVLPNGLTLIIHEDHSDPIVHVDVTYHVGSAREEINKSGFAHFFEHMMFQGSDNVADEEHFKIVTEAGGTLNGTTNRDRTNYFETLPANQLEVALWLEADRMGFLLDAVTQKKFEVQRATVKNERGQNYDNRPYGLVQENIAKNLYPYGHPYSWLTIGYVEDLDRVDVNDLKNFFLRWYGPNNAVLTVAGDVNPKEVVKLVEKYFGPIPRGPEVKNMPPMPAKLDKDRYVSFEDNYIRLPLLAMVFPVPQARSADETALDCLAEILGQGKNSILYQKMIKTQQALQASCFNNTSELAGEFSFQIIPSQGKNLAEMEKMLREAIAEFEKRGISDDDIKKFVAQREASLINRLSSVAGKASMLAAYQTFTGNPNYITEEFKRLRNLKKEDVIRVYNQYIKGKPAVILSYYPKGQRNLIAAEDNYTIDKSGYVAPDYGYAGLKYNKPKDNFDRSKKPAPGPNPVIKVPKVWRSELSSGIQVLGTQNNEIPTVTLLLSLKKGGHLNLTPEKAGTADLLEDMMNEGTENYTAEQFSQELEKLGSSISVSAGDEGLEFRVQCLKKNLDKTLKLFEERLYRSKFTPEDFERIKKQTLQTLKNRQTQAAFVASDVFGKVLHGFNEIRAYDNAGTVETYEKLTLDDVRYLHEMANLRPGKVSGNLVIVGDITDKEILPKLSFLGKVGKGTPADDTPEARQGFRFKYTPEPIQPIAKTQIYLVDKPKSAQAEIRIGYVTPAVKYDALGESYKITLMNYVLGGAFNSRINLNLREDKGWTYGARSSFVAGDYDMRYTASGGIKIQATDSAVFEFMKEIRNYAENGITDKELAFTKSSIGQSEALRYETSFQKAAFLNRILTYNLPTNFTEKQNEILKNITKEEINALAKKYLPYNNMAIVVVADKSVVAKGLMRLGYQITELDVNGKVLVADLAQAEAEKARLEAEKAKAEAEKARLEAEKAKAEAEANQKGKKKKKERKKKKAKEAEVTR